MHYNVGKNNPMFGKKGKLSPWFGRRHSSEARLKMSLDRIGEKNSFYGKLHSSKTKEKIRQSRIGKHHSLETKEKLRTINKGVNNPMFGKHLILSAETIKKRSGKNHPFFGKSRPEFSNKIRGKSNPMFGKGYKIMGEKNPMYGIHLIPWNKGKSRPEISGEKSPTWKGGISFEPYGLEFNRSLKRQIRERDNHTCQLCGSPENIKKHAIHHIDYNKKNNCFNNLILLCNNCHSKTNMSREYWKNYFFIWTGGTASSTDRASKDPISSAPSNLAGRNAEP